eukprot:4407516-Pyramimonas_sp.AAC.1
MAAAGSNDTGPLGPAAAGPRARLSAVYTAKCGKVWLPVGGDEQPMEGSLGPCVSGRPRSSGGCGVWRFKLSSGGGLGRCGAVGSCYNTHPPRRLA